MSTNRHMSLPTQKPGRGPNGRRFCRWCEKEVSGRRLCWCSQKCIDEYDIAAGGAIARGKVGRRDQGICAMCKIDTRALAKKAAQIGMWVSKHVPGQNSWNGEKAFLRGLGFTRDHLWEMDHILPVSEGGGECGLDNLRTLCIPCHNLVTAQLRGRLAATARREKEGARQLSFG